MHDERCLSHTQRHVPRLNQVPQGPRLINLGQSKMPAYALSTGVHVLLNGSLGTPNQQGKVGVLN